MRIERFVDPRDRREYAMSELITAGIAMFILRQGSRNEMNLSRKEARFLRNYEQILKKRLPHMDTVDALLRELDVGELERLKAAMAGALIEKKVLHKWRLLGKSYVISVDATHVATYEENYCGECLTRTVNKGKKGEKTLYFHYVLEAKLVTSSGLALSIASEWVANTGREFDKQDCELKAFYRLAEKLKTMFPRLPICLTGDGLYPNATVMGICERNGWDFILTFKDTNLPSVWQEISLRPDRDQWQTQKTSYSTKHQTTHTYRRINDLAYENHTLNWLETIVERVNVQTGEIVQNRFVHISNLDLTVENAPQVSEAGRMRWKIENEGFNIQKNNGYELGHKFSEVSFNALQNYYQCLQIAHIINQLVEHSTTIATLLTEDKTLTIKFLWRKLISLMDEGELELLQKRRCQIRLV